jgi:hypothetical protein
MVSLRGEFPSLVQQMPHRCTALNPQPTQIDYSDLYSILSFFIGPPDGRKGGNDHLAQQIAEQGRQFGIDHWRWEDMQAYMFRMLLE